MPEKVLKNTSENWCGTLTKASKHIDFKCWCSLSVACSYFEAFLKVVVLFKEHGIIDDDLWRGDAKVNNAVIHCFCRLRTQEENGGRITLHIYNSEINERSKAHSGSI